MTEGTKLILVRVGADNHDVRADMKVIARAVPGFIGNPRADVHVSNADALDVRLLASQAIFDPLHERDIEAAGFVVGIAGDAGKAGPFVRAFSQNAILSSGRGGPIENGRVAGDKLRPRAQSIVDLLLIRNRVMEGGVHLRKRSAAAHEQGKAQREKKMPDHTT